MAGELQRSGFLPLLVTVEQAVQAPDTAGQPIDTWTSAPGLENLPAMRGRLPGSEEVRTAQGVVEHIRHKFLLLGYFASIDDNMRLRDSEEKVWDIVAVEHDGLQTITQLNVRRVLPAAEEGA